MSYNFRKGDETINLKSSDFLRDIAIGISDGLTVPFALAIGLSTVMENSNIIMITGLAVIAAGSIAMGMGGYLAGKTEQDQLRRLVKDNPGSTSLQHTETGETRAFFANIGLPENLQDQAMEEISKDKERWDNFITNFQLAQNEPDPKRALKSAFNIGTFYIAGGLIPLAPYFFYANAADALPYCIFISIVSLLFFGYLKSRITGTHAWWGALRITATGVLAAAAAFGVAKLFVDSVN